MGREEGRKKKQRCRFYTAAFFKIIKKLQRSIDRMGWEEVMILGVHQSWYLFDTQHS